MSLSRFLDELDSAPVETSELTLPERETASCEEAWAYENSTSPANAVCCSRRAGKTIAAGRRAVRVLLSEPNACVQIVSLIRLNARKHFWRPICKLLDQLKVAYDANETQMLLRINANGSQLQCYGVDDVGGTKAVQGDRSSLFIIDECHLPNDQVLNLLMTIAEPMLVDTGGMMDLLGLPPDVEPSTFSEALDNPEWKTFHWDMFAHDLPDSIARKRGRVEAIIKKRGLSWDHPIIQRQYLGKRVRDPTKTAYEYLRGRNDYDPRVVDFSRGAWFHAVGQDQGWSDKDALAVLGWRQDDPRQRVYVRFVWNRNHLPTSLLKKLTAAIQIVYRPCRWVADHSGGGDQRTIYDLSEHLGIALERKPTDVSVSLGLINDDFRTGRLLFPTSDTETERVEAQLRRMFRGEELEEVLLALHEGQVQPELTKLVASVSKTYDPVTRKLKINTQAKHVDISEAIRYGHHAVKNHLASAPAPVRKLTPEEREEEAERQEMEESGRDAGRAWYQRMARR